MKYILEIKSEYEDSFKGVMILGAKDSNLFVDTLAVENLEQYTPVDVEKIYDKAYRDGYNKGLKDGKQTVVGAAELREKLEYQKGFKDGKAQVERGCDGCKYECVEKDEEPCAHCANCYINHWTAKDDKIVVGDEVYCKGDDESDSGVVTWVGKNSIYVMWQDGSAGEVQKDEYLKTGRHFDIQSILEAMRND